MCRPGPADHGVRRSAPPTGYGPSGQRGNFRSDRPLYLDHARTAARRPSPWKNSEFPIPFTPSTSPRTSSSSRNSWRSRPNNRIPAIVDRDNRLQPDGIRRDPHVPGRKGRTAACRPHLTRRYRVDRMADVADGRRRADARPGAPFREIQQAGKSAYAEERYLKEAQPALRRPGQAPRRRASSSPTTIRSPTSPSGRGSRASNGRPLISTSIPTSSAGTWRSRHGRRCRRATRCQRTSVKSRCRRPEPAVKTAPPDADRFIQFAGRRGTNSYDARPRLIHRLNGRAVCR